MQNSLDIYSAGFYVTLPVKIFGSGQNTAACSVLVKRDLT